MSITSKNIASECHTFSLECGVDGNAQDGVKSNAKNHRGETALHVVSRGRYDPESQDGVCIAQLLLERGVDVNAQDKDHDPVTSCILQWKARDGMRAP